MRRTVLPWLLLLPLVLCLGSACGVRRVNACDDGRAEGRTCVSLQLEGEVGEVEVLTVLLYGGGQGGQAETVSQNAFHLPAAVAVVLAPGFSGSVSADVTALRNRQVAGRGDVLTVVGQGTSRIDRLLPLEHRVVEVQMHPPDMRPPSDLGPPRD